MTEFDLGKVVGDDGEAGNGIASITKTGTSGLADTYTITFDDGSTTTFTVTNGSDASVTIQTSWGSTTSDSKVPSEKLTKDSLDNKVSKSSTTGLLKNDGSVMTSGTGSSNYSAGNHTHSGYITTSSTTGLIKNDGTVDTTTYLSSLPSHNHDDRYYTESEVDTALSGKQATLVSGTNIKTVNNESILGSGNITIQGGSSVDIVTAWESTPSDSKVASEKLVKDTLDGKASSTHTHGNLTNDGKVGSTANYFVYTTTSGEITSKQKIGNITTSGAIGSTSGLPIITTTSGVLTTGSFGTGSGTFAEGNHTHSGYISTSSTTGLVKNDGSIDTNTYLTSSAITGMLTTSDVANNLTTTSSGKVLDARQGKALADLIGDAITYINQ